jgi:hypothetical protein
MSKNYDEGGRACPRRVRVDLKKPPSPKKVDRHKKKKKKEKK